MDTEIFQHDWHILFSELLQAVEITYGASFAQFLSLATSRSQYDKDTIEDLFASMDFLQDHDLACCSRALGLCLEMFTVLQHVHKTMAFSKEKKTEKLLGLDVELELFITIQEHSSLSEVVQNMLNSWIEKLSLHRHYYDTPFPTLLREQFQQDCIFFLKEENIIERYKLKKAFDTAFQCYIKNVIPAKSVINHLVLQTSNKNDLMKIGFSLDCSVFNKEMIDILLALPKALWDCHSTSLCALAIPNTLDNKKILEDAMISGQNWPEFLQEACVYSLYKTTPIILRLQAQILFDFLDAIVQKIFQKRLRRLLEDRHDALCHLDLPFEKIKKLYHDFSAQNRHVFDILETIKAIPSYHYHYCAVSDLRNSDQLIASQFVLNQLFEIKIQIMPCFEHASSLEQMIPILQAYFDIQIANQKKFEIEKILLGHHNHMKDKSFWWTHTQLYHAQNAILDWAEQHSVSIKIVQSRGGSLARGSVPTRCLMSMSLFSEKDPYFGLFIYPDAARQRLQSPLTVEMTLWRYTKELINQKKHRSINQFVEKQQAQLAQYSLNEVVYYAQEQPDMIDYFYSITPAENLSDNAMHILKNHRVEEINSAIWFGCWTQSRLLLPLWLGLGSMLLQWDHMPDDLKNRLSQDRCIQALFILSMISLSRVDIVILKAYEKELLSHHLEELGEHLAQRYQKVVALTQKFIENYGQDHYVRNFKNDMLWRSRYLSPLHLLQIQMLRRSRVQWPEQHYWREKIRESIMFIGLGLQNSV